MRKLILIWTLAITLAANFGVAEAFPVTPPHLDGGRNGQIVLASTKAQRDYAGKQCRRRFGERLLRYSVKGNRYICGYRASNATITKKALKVCSNMNATFDHLTGFTVKGNRYISRFMCRRRPSYSGAGDA